MSVALLQGLLQANYYWGVPLLFTRPLLTSRDSWDSTQNNLTIILLTGPLAYMTKYQLPRLVAAEDVLLIGGWVSTASPVQASGTRLGVTEGRGIGERLSHSHLSS